MVHGKNRIPYRIDRRLSGLADLTMLLPSRLGCPLSLKTPNMGNTGQDYEKGCSPTSGEVSEAVQQGSGQSLRAERPQPTRRRAGWW